MVEEDPQSIEEVEDEQASSRGLQQDEDKVGMIFFYFYLMSLSHYSEFHLLGF
jgi:hypothetical protein